MHNSLLRAINLGFMMMEKSHADAYFPMIANMLLGKPMPIQQFQAEVPGVMYAASSGNGGSIKGDKRVAVIPLKGAIIKYDEACGNYGTETVAEWIRNANANPQIDAIVLDIDTPGGMGMACQEPSAAIQSCGKPILGYTGNGVCASAGYWIASHCDEIYANYSTDQVGSIGTYVTLMDLATHYKEYWKLDLIEVYATRSTEKNKAVREALEGNTEKLLKEHIDPFNEAFIKTVKDHRPDVSEEAFTGKLFFAEDAQKAGLIDGLKSLEEVVKRAAQLAP